MPPCIETNRIPSGGVLCVVQLGYAADAEVIVIVQLTHTAYVRLSQTGARVLLASNIVEYFSHVSELSWVVGTV